MGQNKAAESGCPLQGGFIERRTTQLESASSLDAPCWRVFCAVCCLVIPLLSPGSGSTGNPVPGGVGGAPAKYGFDARAEAGGNYHPSYRRAPAAQGQP